MGRGKLFAFEDDPFIIDGVACSQVGGGGLKATPFVFLGREVDEGHSFSPLELGVVIFDLPQTTHQRIITVGVS